MQAAYKDLRSEQRLRPEEIPLDLQRLNILMPLGREMEIRTVDASLNGFGFIANEDGSCFSIGQRIGLLPFGKDDYIYAEIRHITPLKNENLRIGVRLLQTKAYPLYRKRFLKITERLGWQ